MNLITKKIVLLFCLIFTISLLTFAQLTGPVSICVSEDASPKDVIAAKEIRRYLYQRTGTLLEIKALNWTSIPTDENVILIGTVTSGNIQQFLTSMNIQPSTSLLDEQYWLNTITDNGRKIILIAGFNELATLRGAYKLMESYGIRYTQVEDVIPEGTITLDFPAIDKVFKPNFAIRGMLPYHSWNPEGPENWNSDAYKSFLNQQLKMGQNFMGLIYDFTSSDVKTYVWSPEQPNWSWNEQGVNAPAAGSHQLFNTTSFGSERWREARKITNSTQRNAYMKNANTKFMTEVFAYARLMGIKTCIGNELGAATSYYTNMFNEFKNTIKPDFYWLSTPEKWVYMENTAQENTWLFDGYSNLLAAKKAANSPVEIATMGWKLGPPSDQFLVDKKISKEIIMSCQNPNVGRNPVQPEWGQITGRRKWVIPWMEDDFNLLCPQLWVKRTIQNATDSKRYGAEGFIGVHWRTKTLTPQMMALAQLGWNSTLTSKSFYDDFCTVHFGSEVASAVSTIFQTIDGNLLMVSEWTDNWPGGIPYNASYWTNNQSKFNFVNQLEALRPNVIGASNLERFDYYLNQFKYMRGLAKLRATRGTAQESASLHETLNALIQSTYTTGEIGNMICLQRQLGASVDKNYTGQPHMVVLTPRTSLLSSEDLNLDIYFVESGTPQRVELFWKPLGASSYNQVTATKQNTNNYFKIKILASELNGEDIEYYIKGTTSSNDVILKPASAPTRNFSVIQMDNLGSNISGINDNRVNEWITIYPNPATNKLTISNILSGSVISVFSLEGRFMSSQVVNDSTVDYDVSGWNKGVYLFKIQEANNLTIKRAVIC